MGAPDSAMISVSSKKGVFGDVEANVGDNELTDGLVDVRDVSIDGSFGQVADGDLRVLTNEVAVSLAEVGEMRQSVHEASGCSTCRG